MILEPLYSSNKDIGAPPQEIAKFVPEPFEDIIINEPPKTQVPVYAQTEIPVKLVKTINPDDIPIIKTQEIVINTDLLTQLYPIDEAINIIKDVESSVPLNQQTAEQVVTSGIITTKNVPVKLPDKVTIKRPKKGIINDLTNFVYNLLYKSKK